MAKSKTNLVKHRKFNKHKYNRVTRKRHVTKKHGGNRFTRKLRNLFRKKPQETKIKRRGLISYQGILMMMYSGLIKKEQINFLFKEGFIDKSDLDNLIIELNDYLQNQPN